MKKIKTCILAIVNRVFSALRILFTVNKVRFKRIQGTHIILISPRSEKSDVIEFIMDERKILHASKVYMRKAEKPKEEPRELIIKPSDHSKKVVVKPNNTQTKEVVVKPKKPQPIRIVAKPKKPQGKKVVIQPNTLNFNDFFRKNRKTTPSK